MSNKKESNEEKVELTYKEMVKKLGGKTIIAGDRRTDSNYINPLDISTEK